jgi:soluble cytochrome b562
MRFETKHRGRHLPQIFQQLVVAMMVLAVGGFATGVVAETTHAKSSLAKEMSGMKKAMRRLQTKVHKPKHKKASLALVKQVKEHARNAQKLTPASVAKLPEPDREKAVGQYQKQIGHLLEALDQLENHLSRGEFDQAKAAYDEVWEVAKKGHKRFRKKE